MEKLVEIIGSLPEPAQSAARILATYGQQDGAHHKMWCIDQAMRVLLGDKYTAFVQEYQDGEDGPITYTWDEGIAP